MARQRLAVRVPMRPKPMISTFLPKRSYGSMPNRWLHLSFLTIECISTARLASVSIINNACSATEGELAVPATISGILRRLKAGISTESYPTPIRVTTFMSFEA